MSTIPLGTTPTADAGRDAVHVAIIAAYSDERLLPGAHVGLVALEGGVAKVSSTSAHLGIVDPFLKTFLLPRERFYLVLYPQTITSLRHEWAHPMFAPVQPPTYPPPAPGLSMVQVEAANAKAASEEWMRRWAMEHMSYDYYGEGEKPLTEAVAYEKALEAGRELHIGPYESARDHIDAEWWRHWERITGLPGQQGESFSCSC